MKAILPVAGMGTRLQPLTFHQPKYLVGVADKPMIQYAIDELLAAGISDFVFVVSPNQKKIQDYIQAIGLKNARFVVQPKTLGNAHAIFMGARRLTENQSVVVSFGDDVLVKGADVIRRMIQLSAETKSSVLLLERVPRALVSHYGVVAALPYRAKEGTFKKGVFQITGLVEKPKREAAPSNLTIVGRYVLTPEILAETRKLCLKKENISASGEFFLTDALQNYLKKGGKVYGLEFTGARFDCGSKLGLMKAQIKFALDHPEFGKKLRVYTKTIV
ncbi:MAG: sugar phosphate nucleotidyltransferase [bacterium]|nr:sugar phosphate nucleotidyltransferase [bacterium]